MDLAGIDDAKFGHAQIVFSHTNRNMRNGFARWCCKKRGSSSLSPEGSLLCRPPAGGGLEAQAQVGCPEGWQGADRHVRLASAAALCERSSEAVHRPPHAHPRPCRKQATHLTSPLLAPPSSPILSVPRLKCLTLLQIGRRKGCNQFPRWDFCCVFLSCLVG